MGENPPLIEKSATTSCEGRTPYNNRSIVAKIYTSGAWHTCGCPPSIPHTWNPLCHLLPSCQTSDEELLTQAIPKSSINRPLKIHPELLYSSERLPTMTAPTDAQWSAMNKLVQSLYQRADCGEFIVKICCFFRLSPMLGWPHHGSNNVCFLTILVPSPVLPRTLPRPCGLESLGPIWLPTDCQEAHGSGHHQEEDIWRKIQDHPRGSSWVVWWSHECQSMQDSSYE